MDTNRENMNALFTTFNVAFTEGMQRGPEVPAELANEYIKFSELAMAVPSNGASTIHSWIEQIPGFRKWLGDRQKKNVTSGKLEVTNVDWEDTISVKRNDIEDDQYGLYAPLFGLLGAAGSDNALWLDMCIDALLANGNWADAAAFFGTTRKYGANTISNASTAALASASLATALTTMMSYKGPNNDPLNVIPAILLVGPSLRDTAWDLVKNSLVSSGTGKGGSIENRTKGRALLRVHAKLTGDYANYWFLLGMKGGMKPVAAQRRKLPVLVRKDSPNDDNMFFDKEAIYGADARGEAFLTLPHLAYMSTGAA